ncbi:MAG: hypothetical protein ACTSRA_10085, partial [Promethearchaeota archaeon]
MSPKTVAGELKIIQTHVKKHTSSDCPFDISENVAKKFLKIKQKSDIIMRLILEAQINEFREKIFDIDTLDEKSSDVIKDRIFKTGDPNRELFNYFLFKMIKLDEDPRTTYKRKLAKLERLKKKVVKKFNELSFRKEFYFDKITAQLVEQYRENISPSEFEILRLIFEFQRDIHFFNWNVVDKDAQIEFLFKIFTLIQVKQNLLDTLSAPDVSIDKETFPELFRADIDTSIRSIVYKILYILEKVKFIRRKLKILEDSLFSEGVSNITKILDPKNLLEDLKVRWKKAKRHEKEIILMRYIKQLNNLNKLLNLHGEVKREIESSRLSDENHELVKKLNALLERFIKPKLILEKERFVEEYQNEFYIIRFIIRRFRKIFFMLKRKRTMSDAYVFKRLLEEIIKKDKKRVLFLLIFVFINSIIGMLIPFLF